MKRGISLLLTVVMILGIFVTIPENKTFNNNVTILAKAADSTTPHLTSISNATSGIHVKWNAVKGATGYRVYKRGAGEKYWTYITTIKNTYYTDTKVVSGNYYRYTARAVVNGKYSNYEGGIYIKRLSNPASIKATNNVFGVKVTWNKVTGANGYRVYRRAAGEKSWTYLGAITTNSFVDSNVSSNIYYKYTIRATSGNTFSYFNDGSLIKHLKTPKMKKLISSPKSVQVQWYGVQGATGYRVYRRGAGETWKLLATVTGTSYVDTTVVKNSYYRYTFRAVSGGYISDYYSDSLLFKFVGANYELSIAPEGETTSPPTTNNVEIWQEDSTIQTTKPSTTSDWEIWEEDEEATIKPVTNTQSTDSVVLHEYEINSQGVITKYLGDRSYVAINPEIGGVRVTGIGDGCFANSSIKSVYIPNTVTYIGARAFENCTYLSNVSFTGATTKITIGDLAFQNCISLSTIHLPAVARIGNSAFGNCTALSTITFADGSEKIGAYCFTNCKALASVSIPESVKEIGQDVFNGCDRSKLTVITPSGSEAETYAIEKAGVMTRTP